MKLQVDESLPRYVNDSVAALERILTSDNFSAFERITRVSRGEIFVLKILLLRDGTSTPTEISEAMRSTKGRVSAILNSLEKKGFVGREIDRDNRRNIIVTLTDSGRDYVIPEDIIEMADVTLPHRLVLTAKAYMERYTGEQLITRVIDKIKLPE